MKRVYTEKEIQAMKNIAKIVKSNKVTGERLNRLDYYLLGGISFREASSAIFYMMEDDIITKNEYYNLNYYLSHQMNVKASKDKKLILNTYFQFGDRVITDIEKEEIWNGLINSGISVRDIDEIVFSGAVREYAIRNGILKNAKRKVRKINNK